MVEVSVPAQCSQCWLTRSISCRFTKSITKLPMDEWMTMTWLTIYLFSRLMNLFKNRQHEWDTFKVKRSDYLVHQWVSAHTDWGTSVHTCTATVLRHYGLFCIVSLEQMTKAWALTKRIMTSIYFTRTKAANLPHKTSTPANARDTRNILSCNRVYIRGYHIEYISPYIATDWNLECQPSFPKFSGLNLECHPNGVS